MGGFFPKLDEKYGDRDREYNWWGCSYGKAGNRNCGVGAVIGSFSEFVTLPAFHERLFGCWLRLGD